MDKQLFKLVQTRITEELPTLRWIDANEGQLNVAERPPLAYPACLIEMSYPTCRELGAGNQQVTAEFRLTIVLEPLGSYNSRAPREISAIAMGSLDLLGALHKALQWWTADGLFMPMRRERVTPIARRDGLRVYEAVYQLDYLDTLAP